MVSKASTVDYRQIQQAVSHSLGPELIHLLNYLKLFENLNVEGAHVVQADDVQISAPRHPPLGTNTPSANGKLNRKSSSF